MKLTGSLGHNLGLTPARRHVRMRLALEAKSVVQILVRGSKWAPRLLVFSVNWKQVQQQ